MQQTVYLSHPLPIEITVLDNSYITMDVNCGKSVAQVTEYVL